MFKLVDDAHEWKKWWSMRWAIITAFLAAIPVAYATMPDDWLPTIPGNIKAGLAFATLISAGLTGASRVVKQKSLEK